MAFAEISSTPEVAHADLHVVQRDEHGLNNRRILRQIQPFLVRGTNIQPKERVPVVTRGERGHAVQKWFVGNFF